MARSVQISGVRAPALDAPTSARLSSGGRRQQSARRALEVIAETNANRAIVDPHTAVGSERAKRQSAAQVVLATTSRQVPRHRRGGNRALARPFPAPRRSLRPRRAVLDRAERTRCRCARSDERRCPVPINSEETLMRRTDFYERLEGRSTVSERRPGSTARAGFPQGDRTGRRRKRINLCANNYLGLADDSRHRGGQERDGSPRPRHGIGALHPWAP